MVDLLLLPIRSSTAILLMIPASGNVDPEQGHSWIVARWPVDNDPHSAAELHNDVLTDFDSNDGAVGYFVDDPHSESGILKVTHGFRRFAGPPGRLSPSGGQSFLGCVGDVVAGTDIKSFQVREQQFEMVTETRCADTPERHMEPFEEEPDKGKTPPIDNTSHAHQTIKTCRSMFIPFCLVECTLDQDLSAREAFKILWLVILQKNPREVAASREVLDDRSHQTQQPTRPEDCQHHSGSWNYRSSGCD